MSNFTKSFGLFLFIFLLLSSASFGQSILLNENDDLFIKDTPGGSKKLIAIKEKNKNIFSEKKKRVKGFVKSDSPDLYVEFHNQIKTRDGESKPAYSPNYIMQEVKKVRQNNKLSKSNQNLNWIERGPGNVSGRTRGLIVDISDPTNKTWFAGSVGGGVWKTTDMGITWENKTNDLPNLATTVLIQSPSNPDVIYCGTGEGFYNGDAVNGSGIFKSIDHGNNWVQLEATANFDFYCVNRLIIDPANPDIVLACTNPGPNSSSNPGGIHRTTDGGSTWSRVYSNSRRVQDLKSNPDNFLIQYAAVNSDGVYKSTDGGLTWNKSSFGITGKRIEIAVSQKNPDYIYASVETSDGSALYISSDAAENWNTVISIDDKEYSWLGEQGWYDNTIAVHPYNERIVFFGGIDLWKAEVSPAKIGMGILSVDKEGLTFISFNNWSGSFNNSGVGKGTDFYNSSPFDTSGFHVAESDYISVELRFGPGKAQKAHRFVAALNGDYEYKDYVEVPFEAWDITNNKQIMISFRDTQNDGVFDLKALSQSKEYISVHQMAYNSNTPDAKITVTNGIIYKNIYTMHPYRTFGVAWDPNNLPTSILRVNSGLKEDPPLASFSNVTDGYDKYQKPYVHVDHHNIVTIPVDEAAQNFWILNGNDGGVAISTNGGTSWREALSGGYNTTQFYGVDKKPGANFYIGGTQDNGTWLSKTENPDKTSEYRHVIGGDGFDALWNYNNPDLIIGGFQYNGFYRSTDAGANWIPATSGLTEEGCFISKIVTSQSDPDVIYTTAEKGVWRSENFGADWFKCGVKATDWFFNSLSTPIAISIADPQVIWAGCWHTHTQTNLVLSKDGGISFKLVNGLTEATQGWITGIDTHPTDTGTAYLTYSAAYAPKILRTTDFGQNWEDISGFGTNSTSGNGFPDVATYCVIVMPYNSNIIWAGTEIGLFESTDNGVSWHYSNNGLPAVSIWDMKIVDDQVVLATHGRGIFSVTLTELNGYKPPVVTLAPLLLGAAQSPDGVLNIQVSLRSSYDSTLVLINSKTVFKEGSLAPGEKIFSITPSSSGKISIQISSYKDDKILKSFPKEVQVYNFKDPSVKYSNNFDTATQDFTGNGFTITKTDGFSSEAIHSPHDYSEETDYYYTLLVPIIVASSNAYLEYDDIAIIEPGEPGNKFGDSQFWDYVVIEGSKDGINWIPVEDGYDCNFNAQWRQIWNMKGTPNSSHFVHHKVNLLNKFQAGDQILLRLRLYSDQLEVGWGWTLDNLSIQSDVVSVEDNDIAPTHLSLEQNFPNPFNPSTKIKYTIPANGKHETSNVSLKIFDILGNEVTTLVNNEQSAGNYEVDFDASHLSSGVYFYVLNRNEQQITRKMLLMK